MRKNVIHAAILLTIMLGLLAFAGCQSLINEIPDPVIRHGLKIGGAIAREYIGEHYELGDRVQQAIDDALADIDEMHAGQLQSDYALYLRDRLHEQGLEPEVIDGIIDEMFPAPPDVANLAVGRQDWNGWMRAVSEGIEREIE